MDSEEPSFDARLRRGADAKAAIAAYAANIVAGYRTLALDVGTTTFLMAAHLREVAHLKIFTNSLRVSTRSTAPARRSTSPAGACGGGNVGLWPDRRRPVRKAVVRRGGDRHLRHHGGGFFDYSFEDTDMKRVYLRRSGLKILLCDSAKFQRMSLVQVGAFADINMLVTDAEPPRALAPRSRPRGWMCASPHPSPAP